MDSLLLEVVESVYHFHLSSAEPIKLCDYQFVSSLQHRQTGLELMALVCWRS
jgi:hypothetical protein